MADREGARGSDIGGSAEVDGDSRPERFGVLDAAPADAHKASPVRWLLVIIPLLVMLLGGGFLVRSVLDRPPAAPDALSDRPGSPVWPEMAARPPLPAMPRTIPEASEPIPAQPTWAFDAAEIVARLPAADVGNGAAFFKMCAACHTAEPAGAHRIGPRLWNIMGREKASYPDYQYSLALKAQGGRWTDQDMARYIYDTRAAVPGGKMAFAGIRDPARLTDVIAYLRTLTDKPLPRSKAP